MTDDGLTQAELFDVFSNARRRNTVRYLRRQGGSTDLASLVEHVAAIENDVRAADVTRAQRRRVYISLYQTHLPMLDDHGIVDWNAEEHRIELLPDPATFDPYLGDVTGSTRRWHLLYAALALVGVVAIGLAWSSLGPLPTAVAPVVAVTLCASMLVVAAVHRVDRSGVRSLPFSSTFRR